ncbi:hypothetical protein CB0940_00630 [Cercospora beticola]|uniref:F-box domain-containing protein n=1 Tax=Cercospora beticola TaxID=122368 RepID=A0A2G5I7G6_CERBT|nr:hypothetical protein CB0940_00630 [Cercospora beticola]PIB00719.1 hypothetical protein CB0940_00630 [Cercospora beticola]WPA96053.1 hypothetical protein RHO25_000659 [Cercospora beticola]
MDAATAAAVNTTAEEHTNHGPVVFHITELFEKIMCNLDMKTLLLAQRVDRHWRTVICASKPLQQKLFFQPATLKQMLSLNAVETCRSKLITKRPGRRGNHPSLFHNICSLGSDKSPEVAIYNPLLLGYQVGRWPNLSPSIRRTSDSTTIRPSWENMFLVQPPPRDVHLTFKVGTPTKYRMMNYRNEDLSALSVVKAAERRIREINEADSAGYRVDLEPGFRVEMYLAVGTLRFEQLISLGLAGLWH